MGRFELFMWMALVSVLVAVVVGGIAFVIGMAAVAWESDARRIRQWARGFFAEHKEAKP